MKAMLQGILVVLLSLTIIGCSEDSNDDGGATTPTTYSGTFTDAPVTGLIYSTASQSGTTDSTGEYKYRSGETITFKLGTLILGSVPVDTALNPIVLAGDSGYNSISTKAKNIAMLLQNLDQNRSDISTITIVSEINDYDFSTIDLNNNGLEASMSALLADTAIAPYIDQTDSTVITMTDAGTAMATNISADIPGDYTGIQTATDSYTPNYTCLSDSDYTISLVANSNNIDINIIIPVNGVDVPITLTTSEMYGFTSNKVTLPAPNKNISFQLENANTNGNRITSIYHLYLDGNPLCKGTVDLHKQ